MEGVEYTGVEIVEYFPFPGDLPNPGIEPRSPAEKYIIVPNKLGIYICFHTHGSLTKFHLALFPNSFEIFNLNKF